jgi:hypothetical protein
MYINKTQAETIFDLINTEAEQLAHSENRLNFIATREELVELMEKIAPSLEDDGWTATRASVVESHRKALEHDKEERKVNRKTQAEYEQYIESKYGKIPTISEYFAQN